MQITLDDLVFLEPQLAWASAADARDQDAAGEREVTWAISVRSTEPHLPPLRGGELLLLTRNVTETLGPSLVELYRQARERAVSALVFEARDPRAGATYPESTPTPLLVWHG
jgi:hypothetical protein